MSKNNIAFLLPLLFIFNSCGSSSTEENSSKSITLTIDAGGDKIVQINRTITIKGKATTSDKSQLSYLWTKGQETLATSDTFSYTPTVLGVDELTFTVQHNSGESISDELKIRVVEKGDSLTIPSISSSQRQRYLDAINQARGKNQDCGYKGKFSATSPLKWSDKLYKSSYEHSYDMAYSETFEHEGSGEETDVTGTLLGKKSSLSERIDRYDYSWSFIGENIGAGTRIDTPEKMVQGWLDSPPHCANLMNSDFAEVGMTMVKKYDAKYTHYWTQDFGTPR